QHRGRAVLRGDRGRTGGAGMTRTTPKKTPKKPAKPKAGAKGTKGAKKPAKRSARPKRMRAFVVQRRIPAENEVFSDPDRVFATKAAAQAFADERNRGLRTLLNPFEGYSPDFSMTGGEKAFFALLKKLHLTAPKKAKGAYAYIDWEVWWNQSYFNMT